MSEDWILTSLSLPNCCFTSADLGMVLDALSQVNQNASLRELSISPQEEKTNPKIRHEGCGRMTEFEYAAAAKFLNAHPHLRVFKIGFRSGMRDKNCLNIIYAALRGLSQLETLEIVGPLKNGDDKSVHIQRHIEAMKAVITHNPHLTALGLQGWGITVKEWGALLPVIRQSKICSLDLSTNNLTRALITDITRLSQLLNLRLGDVKRGTVMDNAVMRALHGNATVEQVYPFQEEKQSHALICNHLAKNTVRRLSWMSTSVTLAFLKANAQNGLRQSIYPTAGSSLLSDIAKFAFGTDEKSAVGAYQLALPQAAVANMVDAMRLNDQKLQRITLWTRSACMPEAATPAATVLPVNQPARAPQQARQPNKRKFSSTHAASSTTDMEALAVSALLAMDVDQQEASAIQSSTRYAPGWK